MATTITKSIGTTGRDYSTLQAWEDAIPASIVATDEIWRGECYNDTEFVVTGNNPSVEFSGVTVDATRYIELTAATGQSFQDHANVRTNALRYNQANGVGIRKTGNYYGGIRNHLNYLRVSRLQFKHDATFSYNSFEGVGSNESSSSLYKDLIIENAASTGGRIVVQAWSSTLVNVIAISRSDAGVAFEARSACTLIGCLAIRPSDLTAADTAFACVYTASVLQSCACFGFTTATSGSWTGSNNATELASGLPGTSNQHSVSYTQTTPWTDADKDSQDFRAIAATSLAANGLYDGPNAPNDISGTARSNPPTIGPWELVAAGPAAMDTRRNRRPALRARLV